MKVAVKKIVKKMKCAACLLLNILLRSKFDMIIFTV
jgi:hypothetical protein